MAVVAVVAVVSVALAASPYLSSNLSEYDGETLWPPAFEFEVSAAPIVSVTSNLPVSQVARAITAVGAVMYSHDYYHRIHTIPQTLNFGNVTTPKTINVQFWNAHLRDINLVSILGEEMGLSFSEPVVPPAVIKALRVITFAVTVTREGESQLNGAIALDFGSDIESAVVPIIATRIEIWPFAPRAEVIEAVEWNTRVLRAKSAEQRICWREVPRRQYLMTHIASQAQSMVARALARRNLDFWLPDWTRAVRANVSTGASVALDDGDVLIWQDWRTWEQTTITAGVLGTVLYPASNVRVMPLVIGRLVDQWSQDRRAGPFAEMSVMLDVAEGVDEGVNTLYPVYSGLPVVMDCVRVGAESFSESVQYEFYTIDNGQAAPQNIKVRDYADVTFGVRWVETNKARAALVREWIYGRRGKWRAFWLPSWDKSLVVESSALGWIQVTDHDIGESNLMFEVDGVWIYRTISSYNDTSGGGVVLALDSPRPAGSVGRVFYLRKCRFNADRIEFRHAAGAGVTVAVPCVEVPDQ